MMRQRHLRLRLSVGILCLLVAFATLYMRYDTEPVQLINQQTSVSPVTEGLDAHVEESFTIQPVRDYCPKGWKDLYPIAESGLSRTLVIARLRNESVDWIERSLYDLLEPNGPLRTAIYTADDDQAPLHPPTNKGHEANIYLSYIIDSYDSLPDVAIFIHAHQITWHNNDLLNADSALIVRNLSPSTVITQGYANLRCHWDPGCPSWIHPDTTQENSFKQEERIIADAWVEIFGTEVAVPHTLAQPCCAQFAVSGERIRSLPKELYIRLRDWIYETELSDMLSGRIFEYLWQFIFTSSPEYCPPQGSCYCGLYGVCFDDEDNIYEDWVSRNREISETREKLTSINDKSGDYYSQYCESPDPDSDDPPEDIGCDERYSAMEAWVKTLEAELDERARTAFRTGKTLRGLDAFAIGNCNANGN